MNLAGMLLASGIVSRARHSAWIARPICCLRFLLRKKGQVHHAKLYMRQRRHMSRMVITTDTYMHFYALKIGEMKKFGEARNSAPSGFLMLSLDEELVFNVNPGEE
jgi:hypothetical protein